MSGWHILIAEPRRERTAVAGLAAHGIRAYCPELPPRRKLAGRKMREVIEPMFPGYLFTPADEPDWSRIRMTRGIQAGKFALRDLTGKPVVISQAILAAIEEKEAEERVQKRRFRPGCQVRVIDYDTPFFDMVGLVERMDGKDRVRVLMSLLGAQTPVRLKDEQLEVA